MIDDLTKTDDLDLSVIPMKPSYWDTWSINMAHAFVWGGFWIAVISAWREGDWGLPAVPLMLLGIGLMIFRGVANFMKTWAIWSQYISLREIRDEVEIKEANEEPEA